MWCIISTCHRRRMWRSCWLMTPVKVTQLGTAEPGFRPRSTWPKAQFILIVLLPLALGSRILLFRLCSWNLRGSEQPWGDRQLAVSVWVCPALPPDSSLHAYFHILSHNSTTSRSIISEIWPWPDLGIGLTNEGEVLLHLEGNFIEFVSGPSTICSYVWPVA